MKRHFSFFRDAVRICLCFSAVIASAVLLYMALPSRESAAVLPVSAETLTAAPGSSEDAFEVVFTGLVQKESDDPLHILLIGQDRRENETAARADAIILCSFLPQQHRLILTSFLRDLYVEIPGRMADRINAAYAYGGMDLLRDTLETNFDINVSGCIEVDFSQFAEGIDALGGVTVSLRQDEADTINKTVSGSLSAGSHLLTGTQALAYARIRNLDQDGDFSRTQRQRTVLTALLQRFRDASLRTLLSSVKEVLPVLTSDMDHRHMLTLAVQIFPMLSDATISSQRIPADGCFSYSTIRNMEVLVADLPVARKFLSDSFRSDVPNES